MIPNTATNITFANAIDRSGLTPFQAAVVQNNKSLADFMIANGAKHQAPNIFIENS